jgi:lipooligosaccharide transport system permease protein
MKADARFSRRFLRVWFRNLLVYRRIWKINFLVPLFEPVFYLLAFGVGLGSMVGEVRYEGRALTYVQFIAPALMATAALWNSFFETTYASFVRMYYQKTFDAMLTTPLSLEEVVTAEIVWGATKAFIAASIMLAVVAAFGYAPSFQALWILPLSILGGLAFGAVGMAFTAFTKSIDMFNLPIFLFVTPMFLFSGTFFPVDALPAWASIAAAAMPLYHLTVLFRSACLGALDAGALWNASYLCLVTLIFFPLALRGMRRRLIK